jgi:dTDP-4-amino-4,6-dideoxygalactose transaminase
MMQEEKRFKIFLSPPFQSGKELDYIHKALETNWLAPGGQSVADFEGALRLQTGRKYCVALNSERQPCIWLTKCWGFSLVIM